MVSGHGAGLQRKVKCSGRVLSSLVQKRWKENMQERISVKRLVSLYLPCDVVLTTNQ